MKIVKEGLIKRLSYVFTFYCFIIMTFLTLQKIPYEASLYIGMAFAILGTFFYIVDAILENKKRKKRDSNNQQS